MREPGAYNTSCWLEQGWDREQLSHPRLQWYPPGPLPLPLLLVSQPLSLPETSCTPYISLVAPCPCLPQSSYPKPRLTPATPPSNLLACLGDRDWDDQWGMKEFAADLECQFGQTLEEGC